jgi:hypothetical protein
MHIDERGQINRWERVRSQTANTSERHQGIVSGLIGFIKSCLIGFIKFIFRIAIAVFWGILVTAITVGIIDYISSQYGFSIVQRIGSLRSPLDYGLIILILFWFFRRFIKMYRTLSRTRFLGS